MKTQYGEVSVVLDGHVAIAEVNRPPNNHVSVELMRDLADALRDLDEENDCRAVVLATAGRVFCGGADLTAPTGIGGQGMEGINPLYVEAVRLFSNKKPIVAAIQGAAVGAGLGLAWSPASGSRRPRRASPPTSSSWASMPASASLTPFRG